MEDLSIKIDTLSDEILILILRKLSNIEVLYSLIGVNQRLNRIAYDSIFVNNLTLFERSSNGSIQPLPHSRFERFFREILPSIHHKIKWLNLESTSMENTLLAATYPDLHGLGLYGIDVENALSLFTGRSYYFDYFHFEKIIKIGCTIFLM
jgi:hypothetical protein